MNTENGTVNTTGKVGSWYEQVKNCRNLGGDMLDASSRNMKTLNESGVLDSKSRYWIRGTSLRWVWNQLGKVTNCHNLL